MAGILGGLPPGILGAEYARQANQQQEVGQLGILQRAMQLKALADQQREKQGLRQALQSDPRFANNPLALSAALSNPANVFAQLTPRQRDAIPIGPNGLAIPDQNAPDGFRVIAPPKQEKPETVPNAVKEYQFAQSQGYKGTFADFQLEKRRAGATNVTTTLPKAEGKYQEKRLEAEAERIRNLEKSAETAYESNLALERFMEASKKGTAGGAEPIISSVQNFLSTFGYSPESLKDVVQMQQAVGRIKAQYMQELGARGLTDKDMQVLSEALPRVNTDRNARENVARIMMKANEAILKDFDFAREEEARNHPELSKKIMKRRWEVDRKSRQQAPDGVPPEIWSVMTPEERKLWK